jgi:dCTP diphosphatase
MSNSDLNTLKQLMREFADTRDWNQFHSPKNLVMALSVEVAEIAEHFQWLTQVESQNLPADKLEKISHELADSLLYLVRLADKLDVDLFEAACDKMRINNEKYPVEKSIGNAMKYTEFA